MTGRRVVRAGKVVDRESLVAQLDALTQRVMREGAFRPEDVAEHDRLVVLLQPTKAQRERAMQARMRRARGPLFDALAVRERVQELDAEAAALVPGSVAALAFEHAQRTARMLAAGGLEFLEFGHQAAVHTVRAAEYAVAAADWRKGNGADAAAYLAAATAGLAEGLAQAAQAQRVRTGKGGRPATKRAAIEAADKGRETKSSAQVAAVAGASPRAVRAYRATKKPGTN